MPSDCALRPVRSNACLPASRRPSRPWAGVRNTAAAKASSVGSWKRSSGSPTRTISVATSPIATISERPASVAGRDLLDPEGVVARVRAVLPPGTARAALHEPSFTGSEREYLADCIETGWVSYGGAYVGKFEAALAQACGVDQGIALTSGTVALQVALTV